MIPQPEDNEIQIPITFDYKGGRNENSKNKWIMLAVMVVIFIIITVGSIRNDNLITYQKALLIACSFYIILVFLRFVMFHELRYSDVYETLKETKNDLPVESIWSIFDIEFKYPFVCYYRNGKKGLFVKMEKDAITGKGELARYDHYEAISDAYNLAHSLNMDIRHIDYMDNIGNDVRLDNLYEQLRDVANPDMEDLLIEVYNNLEEEMSRNYSSFDIYLYISREKTDAFLYNVQNVSQLMLGGNFITYRLLDRNDIRSVCMALFNLHDFSVTDACESIMSGENSSGVVPIRVIDYEGNVQKLNKTQAEKELERKRNEELALERKNNKKKRKKKGTENDNLEEQLADEDFDLFD